MITKESKKETKIRSIRLSLELLELIEKAAKDDERSVNNLIVVILKKWLKKHGYLN